MSSLSETNYQYEVYLEGSSPQFLTKWMPAPEQLGPFIGDFIEIRGDSRQYKIIRVDPPLGVPIEIPITSARKIYVEIVDPSQPETDNDLGDPVEYKLINTIF